jgi:hypothetical protein
MPAMILIDAWKAWFLAACIIIFDILLILSMTNRPVQPAANRAVWDFRISELRQLEDSNGHYRPTRSASVSEKVAEGPLAAYFPGMQSESAPFAWWLATGTSASLRGETHPGDAAGQVL